MRWLERARGHRKNDVFLSTPTDKTDKSLELEDQYPEDVETWKEAKLIFEDAFPPVQDPVSSLRAASSIDPESLVDHQQEVARHLYSKFSDACPKGASRDQQSTILEAVLREHAQSEDRKINSLMLAD